MSQTAERNSATLLMPSPARARYRSRVVRPLLMIGGVVLLAIGAAVLWLRGGDIVSVDDATVQAARVAVSTDVAGIVATVDVNEGQAVHRGEILFRLDDRPFRIALAGAEAALGQSVLEVAALKQDYQRAQRDVQAGEAQQQSDAADNGRYARLVASGAVTRSEADGARFRLVADSARVAALRAQAGLLLARLAGDPAIDPARTPAVRQAQARVDEMRRELADSVVRAPFAGVVTQVASVQPGMYLGAATPAFALVSTDQVWAEGSPKETELTWVKPGDSVRVRVDTYPGRDWNGVVESIAPASGAEFSVLPAQNTSGNWVKVVQRIPLRVRLTPQADAPPLRAGMSVVLQIETGHQRHLSDLLP